MNGLIPTCCMQIRIAPLQPNHSKTCCLHIGTNQIYKKQKLVTNQVSQEVGISQVNLLYYRQFKQKQQVIFTPLFHYQNPKQLLDKIENCRGPTCSEDHDKHIEQMLERRARCGFFQVVNLTTWAVLIIINLVLLLQQPFPNLSHLTL